MTPYIPTDGAILLSHIIRYVIVMVPIAHHFLGDPKKTFTLL